MDYAFLLRPAAQAPTLSQERRLYANLRTAIVTERLPGAHRLPGTRELAAQLGIARNSVIYAYEQLAAEGYLQSNRQGTVVARHVSGASLQEATLGEGGGHVRLAARSGQLPPRAAADPALPFTLGLPALTEFPLREWQRVGRAALKRLRLADLGAGPPGGSEKLRRVLAERLRASRELRCTPEQIFVTDGTQPALEILARVTADARDVVWIESPGYRPAASAFRAAGLAVHPMAVDEHGMVLEGERAPPPRLIYVTPSHQYPLGSVLARDRRVALIAVAKRAQALVLEDDYDSDFRYDGEPLPALQELTPDAPVTYLGTFSKTMFPGIRLAYLVVPKGLAAHLAERHLGALRGGRAADQEMLATFIAEGRYTRHLRRMRRLYTDRQQALREALRRHLPQLQVKGAEAGLHLVLALPPHVSDVQVCRLARARGVNPAPLSEYYEEGQQARSGLVIGFGNTPLEAIEPSVRALAGAIEERRSTARRVRESRSGKRRSGRICRRAS